LAGTVIRALGADPSDVHAALEQEPDDDRPVGRSAARSGIAGELDVLDR
jgi:hypothetical protein